MKIFGVYTTDNEERESARNYIAFNSDIDKARETVAYVIEDEAKVVIEEIILDELDSGAKFEVYSSVYGLVWKNEESLVEAECYGFLSRESRSKPDVCENCKEDEIKIYLKKYRNYNDIAYACIGKVEDNNFTGMVYGYGGEGKFSTKLIVDNAFLSEDTCDRDTVEELFQVIAGKSLYFKIKNKLEEFFDSIDLEILKLREEKLELLENNVYSTFEDFDNLNYVSFENDSIVLEKLDTPSYCNNEGKILLNENLEYRVLTIKELTSFFESDILGSEPSWISIFYHTDTIESLLFTNCFQDDLKEAVRKYVVATEDIPKTYKELKEIFHKTLS